MLLNMSRARGPASAANRQSGVVLIVSLVLLLIMTLLGVSNMRTSTVQLNMAVNSQSRSEAFSAAEFVLKSVSSEIQTDFATKYDPDRFINNCSGNSCYAASCNNGLCFEGDASWNSPPECSLDNGSSGMLQDFIWMRDSGAVWKEPARHATRSISVPRSSQSNAGNIDFQASYIVEFLCYTHKDPDPDSGGLVRCTFPRGLCASVSNYRARGKPK